jgi:hypothetical protein
MAADTLARLTRELDPVVAAEARRRGKIALINRLELAGRISADRADDLRRLLSPPLGC